MVIKILSVLCYVPIIYPQKFGKNPSTGSQDIVQTKKCDSEAYRIRTKNNMSPLPVGVGHKYGLPHYAKMYSCVKYHWLLDQ